MGGMRIEAEGVKALSGAVIIPLSEIEVAVNHSRDGFAVDISDLKEKMRRDGQLVPGLGIRIKPSNKVRLTAGFGRYQALAELQAEDGKSRFMAIVVTDGNDRDAFFRNLSENHNRRGLSPMNYSNAIREMGAQYNMTTEAIAAEFNMSGPWVWQHQQLQSLSREIQEKVHDGEMPMGTALALLQEDENTRQALYEAMKEEVAVGSINAVALLGEPAVEVTKDSDPPKKDSVKRKGKARPKVPKMGKKTLAAAKEKIGTAKPDKSKKRNWQELNEFWSESIGSPVFGPKMQELSKLQLLIIRGEVEAFEAFDQMHRMLGEHSYTEDGFKGILKTAGASE